MRRGILLLVVLCLFSGISLAEGYTAILQDSLGSKTVNLDEVVVTGTRVPVPRDVLPVPISVVHRDVIEQSEEVSLLPVLMQQVPGLYVTSRGMAGYGVSGGAGGISMRGFAGGAGRVLILIDGHPQYATIYGHPVADAYIASDAQRVEVSRGAASILYGSNAMGGAINIITRQAMEDGNKFSARLMGGSYGTQRYSLTDTYRNGRLFGVVSGNYERTDGHRVNSDFKMWTGSAKLGYDLSEEWRVVGNVNISKAKGDVPGQESRPLLDGMTDVLRGMSGLSLENRYEKTRGAVNFYYNWGDHKINDGYYEGGSPRPYLFKSTDYMGGVNIYQAVNLFKGNTITGGFDAKLYGGNAYRDPEKEIYADHVKLHEVAGYVLVQQQLWKFMLEAGLRLENHKLYGTEWVPQAGVSFKAAEQTSLKFSFSKGFRTPNMRELYMYASANEDLLPERSFSYDFTVSQGLLDNRMSVDLTLFYTKGDNIIESVEIGESRYQNRNVGEFENKGIEFSLNYQILNNLSLHANYSYLDMQKKITGAPRNKLYAGMTYRPGKFTLSAGAQVIDKLYLATGKTVQTSDYTLVDARVAYRPLKWMEVFVKGDNLLAQRYETMLGYPMPKATFMGGVSFNL
ncbi:outer membrane cobalamin receptor [Parabacteroides sp. PF5-5]|uniref:TonB-dependent receptor n=1 Tax=unclassified Parabacteroides TaxID=2649774 RepID=UPI002476D04B|nr:MULTISPECIES: TonB-dependent receptor [unclassified Parabacteroides]MDH6303409.1 outer membrane cobalamin receptor [Parabacteroides sp. PH5-39]MDH6314732.1 outer membrane cobalamin receptor [Parabacteroides sp. PF5-13]MDH6318069.1 outer membrane cobalamin receptor [Parabacteroides sp. PH5-13]MDH6322000.1 outer membrane cobalamin receptor [Parabacteroides sp. PH5-8]MDH6326123.1 outer membrane cobalamin receptor [Parabacteroides sp. PH5-41]